jgi:hypothetical protein
MEEVELHGTKWVKIARMFPGRTNSLKNRWHGLKRGSARPGSRGNCWRETQLQGNLQ